MRVLSGILCVIVILASCFFILNHNDLEVVKLDNGIGSYSLVIMDLYDSADFDSNPNISAMVYPSNWLGGYFASIYYSEFSLIETSLDIPYILSLIPVVESEGVDLQGTNIMAYIIAKSHMLTYNIQFDFDIVLAPSNVSLTPQQIYNTYGEDGFEMVIKNAKLYHLIQGHRGEHYSNLEELTVVVRSAPVLKPDGTLSDTEYLVTVVPTQLKYEFNFMKSLEIASQDAELIDKVAPYIYNGFLPLDFSLEGLQNNFLNNLLYNIAYVLIYPFYNLNFIFQSIELLVSDLTGCFVINKFGGLV